jgi:predicted ribosomally synthesized peptide with nif11-like leader
MSKNQVFEFLTTASQNETLGEKVRSTHDRQQLQAIARSTGFDFSLEQLDEALRELSEQPNFFRKLASAALEIFSPNHDNYPSVGVQPYEGEIDR